MLLKELPVEELHKMAFFAFGEEAQHLLTAEHLHAVGNHEGAREAEEWADKSLDFGWEVLEEVEGFRPRDIARFRKASAEQFLKLHPVSFPIGG